MLLCLYQRRGGFFVFMATYIPSIVVLSQPAQRRIALIAAERSYTRCKYHHTELQLKSLNEPLHLYQNLHYIFRDLFFM